MATLSVESFIDYVERSELVEAATLQAALAEFKAAHDGQLPEDADLLANFLIDKKLLTSWHVEKLMEQEVPRLLPGQVRMLRLIGSGGMSTVYLAEHKLMHRQRAIKVLPQTARQRFQLPGPLSSGGPGHRRSSTIRTSCAATTSITKATRTTS